jgi:membrane-bound lytic murein transglycosylase
MNTVVRSNKLVRSIYEKELLYSVLAIKFAINNKNQNISVRFRQPNITRKQVSTTKEFMQTIIQQCSPWLQTVADTQTHTVYNWQYWPHHS